jgi:hypothetical protein
MHHFFFCITRSIVLKHCYTVPKIDHKLLQTLSIAHNITDKPEVQQDSSGLGLLNLGETLIRVSTKPWNNPKLESLLWQKKRIKIAFWPGIGLIWRGEQTRCPWSWFRTAHQAVALAGRWNPGCSAVCMSDKWESAYWYSKFGERDYLISTDKTPPRRLHE